jgi:Ca-activated chloride channel family protein
MRNAASATIAVLLIATGLPLSAQGWIVPRPCGMGIVPADSRERMPVMPIRDCRANITRTRSDVHVELENRVLHYEVEERFVNRGGVVGEADYLFPLPANAAFQDLKLSIDGELVSGETMNAADARRVYEQIVRTQRDPALVEWMGYGLLRARIFPLNPGEEKRIVVRFQSVAPREGDALRIDYFRGGEGGSAMGGTSAGGSVRDGGSSSFALSFKPSPELGTPYSPTHSLDLSDHDGLRTATVRGDARDVTLLVPARRASAPAITMLPYAPGNEDGFALVTVTPPLMQRNDATPRDITLVLDVSGSMQGRKMEQARAAGRQLLGTLRPTDRIRLIDFSSDVRTFKDDFVAATPDNVRAAMRYLDALEAQGGTNIEAALREAVRPAVQSGRLPLILFVTDGEPTVGDPRPDHLTAIAAGSGGEVKRRIFTFGLGSDVNVSLLEQLALEGHGTSQFVRPDESVERMVGIVASRLVDPVLTDVRVHVEGDVKLSKTLPAQSADVFADRDLVVLARYSGHGPARIVVDGTRRGAPVTWTSAVDFPERERQNPFVARLWASQRVGYLSAQRRKESGGTQEVDEEIRSLGERYGIPSEFTSYLVTEPRFAMNHGLAAQSQVGVGVAGGVARASGTPTPAPSMAPVDATPAGSRSNRFEEAKTASVQRAASSLAILDSVSAASAPLSGDGRTSTRRIDGRTFVLLDGAWTDIRFHTGMHATTIKPYSNAYWKVMDTLPELRAVFALGASVTVVGRDSAIRVADDGVSDLSKAALDVLSSAW